jgi:hypothetical protein
VPEELLNVTVVVWAWLTMSAAVRRSWHTDVFDPAVGHPAGPGSSTRASYCQATPSPMHPNSPHTTWLGSTAGPLISIT